MSVHVLTQRNAPDRQGVNRGETQLNPKTVRFDRFGRLGSYPVQAPVFAQPLVVSDVLCADGTRRSLLIVATMANEVFAFDADFDFDSAGDQLAPVVWQARHADGTPLAKFGGVDSRRFKDGRYGDFYGGTIGILGTPVIELTAETPAAGTIYLVSFQLDENALAANGKVPRAEMFQHILYAVDLGNGQVLREQLISGQYPGTGYRDTTTPPDGDMGLNHTPKVDAAKGTVSMSDVRFDKQDVTVTDVTGLGTPNSAVQFNSIMQLQRPGLLLHEGNIFIAFGSRGDEDPWHGWIFSYDKQTFGQTGILCTTPRGARGGIWQAGQGLVLDANGDIFCCSGNGDNDGPGAGHGVSGRNHGESFLGLRFDSTGIRLNGWFCLFKDFAQQPPEESLNDTNDDDFGAGAPALLPDQRVVAGGKDGWFFLIDPDQLDKVSSRDAVPQAFKASFNVERGSRVAPAPSLPHYETRHIHGSPVVWDDGSGTVLAYVWGENDLLRVYQYTPEMNGDPATGRFIQPNSNFKFGETPPMGVELARGTIYASNEQADRRGMPGGFLALTVNGPQADSAILWAAYPPYGNANNSSVMGTIAAFDASDFDRNLAYWRVKLLWHSRQNEEDASVNGNPVKVKFAKFCVPTIANGRVYQPTGSGEVAVYGRKPNATKLALSFDGGPEGFALNGSAFVSETGHLVLTDLAHGETSPNIQTTPTFLAGSFFTRSTFPINQFETTFTVLLTNADADGFAFVVQAEGPHALGNSGSGVGYSIDPLAPFPDQQGTILHSFAVKFALRDIVDGQSVEVSYVILMVNGQNLPAFFPIDLLDQPTPLNLRDPGPLKIHLKYSGQILQLDLSRGAVSQSYSLLPGDIPQQINSVLGQAYLGFSGGTGELSARQEIVDWVFAGS